jgi:hypothetical protein
LSLFLFLCSDFFRLDILMLPFPSILGHQATL